MAPSYIETDSGNKVSRQCSIVGSQSIILGMCFYSFSHRIVLSYRFSNQNFWLQVVKQLFNQVWLLEEIWEDQELVVVGVR